MFKIISDCHDYRRQPVDCLSRGKGAEVHPEEDDAGPGVNIIKTHSKSFHSFLDFYPNSRLRMSEHQFSR